MKNLLLKLIFLLILQFSTAQISGTITDSKGQTIPGVSIIIENSYINTSSNDKGYYDLNHSKPGNVSILYRCLGFKTKKITENITNFPFKINVVLADENYTLNEVVISNKENPANAIIKKTIAARKENTEKTAQFSADFYSRGLFKMANTPKKILGQKIGDLDGALDSTGTGIIYLSETVSKITFQKPNNLNEKIIASKVSGRDNGFSFNTARASVFDIYDNTINLNNKVISPIASNAFAYYKYKLEGTFQDENNFMINKIKVIPKRDGEPVFNGYIYVVENTWAIYGVDLDVKGYRMQQEFLDVLNLKQNFSYNKKNQIWARNSQSLNFTAGIFGIKFNGNFNYVYTNYNFDETITKKTFSNEIVSFAENSNKKDTLFWQQNRPIPLTDEENKDYIKKDSIYKKRNSKQYLDSIDSIENKFKILSPIKGYTYKNSFKKQTFSYNGLFDLSSLSFNTVQGYNFNTGLSYTNYKNEEEKGKLTTISTQFNYGFSDKRLRILGNFYHRFNSQNYASLTISAGTKATQINQQEPISKLINTIATLFFKENFIKLYNKEFASVVYSQNVSNGIFASSKIEFEQRKPLSNTTDYVTIKRNRNYTSNNPLHPNSDIIPLFKAHQVLKFSVGTRINFGSKYISRPDAKITINNSKYPTIGLSYLVNLGTSQSKYSFQKATAQVNYELSLANKGEVILNSKAAKFFNAKNISFLDFAHFNGNQTFFQPDYTSKFFLLPYYSNSTNNAYFENHTQYCDNGYLMNKIPLINKLKSQLMLSHKSLFVPNQKPYSEIAIGLNNLGFGKYKLLRIDYVKSYQNGIKTEGFMFGFKF